MFADEVALFSKQKLTEIIREVQNISNMTDLEFNTSKTNYRTN